MKLVLLSLLIASSLACRYKGNTYSNQETWEEKGAFKMKCIIESNGSWRTEVVGCLTPDGVEVPVNGSKGVGSHEWSCQITDDGHISLRQEMGKNADCAGGHTKGSTWVEKSFEFKCEEGGQTKFVGCITTSGIRIADGQIKDVAGMLVKCQQHPNGTISLNGVGRTADAPCIDNAGMRHSTGEKWLQNKHFQMECKPHGETAIVGCVVDAAKETIAPLNTTLTVGEMVYHCEQRDGSFKFYNKPKNA